MSNDNKKITIKDVKGENSLKVFLHENYLAQIKNFFGDEKQALKFLSSVMTDVQKTPKLLECDISSLINSYMTMAQLGLMPSGVSGEAYVLPYNNNKSGMVAQFQLGYQGLVTLFYKAGVKSIDAEIVRKNDIFKMVNNVITHEYDPFSDDRGEAIGAYTIIKLQAGGVIQKAMSKKEIIGMASKFSKSFDSNFSPWNEVNDPNLWMWRKTVLKQAAKLVPKNETIYKAISEDNKDSIIEDAKKLKENTNLNMGSFLVDGKNKKDEKTKTKEGEDKENIS